MMMTKLGITLTGYLVTLSLFPLQVMAEEIKQGNEAYFIEAQKILKQRLSHKPITTPAKNIILFIGDGMGVSTVTATRILEGQLKGGHGEDHILSWENFPYTALSKTYNTNQQVADSAGTASAFMTGSKTKAGVISVNKSVTRGNCHSSKGNSLDTILELSEKSGLNTGIITTTTLTHATPAAAYAHSPERGWQNDGEIPSAEKIAGCIDIAQQFINFPLGNGIEVAFGGGRQHFFPENQFGPEGEKGKRKDSQNLISLWQQKYQNGQYIWNSSGFEHLNIDKEGPILGLFSPNHMEFEADRSSGKGDEPSLSDMTQKALQILEKKNNGYFLYVEAGRIDHGHHKGNAYRALHDGIALAKAVQTARDMTNNDETLIIVTADHSHGFTMAGYATRGNPILGKLQQNDPQGNPESKDALGLDNMPYTTLGYHNGLGAKISGGRQNITEVNTETKNYIQQSLIPTLKETHSGEDVAIYATGPGAYLFQGVVEQNYIFHVMHHAFRLGENQN